jgi:NTE family protein
VSLTVQAATGEALPTTADAVIEGGGVHVLALAGAMREFEARGIGPWVSVGGVGAGSIIASYLTTGHDANDVVGMLAKVPWKQFLDYGPGGKVLGGYRTFVRRGAVARGQALHTWFNRELEHKTFSVTRVPDGPAFRLALIAYDYTHRRLIRLPDDLRRYRFPGGSGPIDPGSLPIADGVAMAMAIPGLFPPVELVELSTGDRSWIVDAGPHSNFPVSLFDLQEGPLFRPTFGFRVTYADRPDGRAGVRTSTGIGWRSALGPAGFQTTPLTWDEQGQSELSRVRACVVPVSGVAPENFRLTVELEETLVQIGRESARTFLDDFSLENYHNVFEKHLRADAD